MKKYLLEIYIHLLDLSMDLFAKDTVIILLGIFFMLVNCLAIRQNYILFVASLVDQAI